MTYYELRKTKVKPVAVVRGRRMSSFAIRRWSLCLAAGLMLTRSGYSAADETPRTGIVDQAGVVDARTAAQLNGWLLELEQKTGAQLKVLTIDTLDGRDIHDYAIETAKRWRLGNKDEDNGTLVVIAVKDRKWRIETGEGIEDALPDAYCDQVAADYFLPNFRRGDFGKGILDGTAVLAQKIAADANVELTGVPKIARPSRRGRSRDGNAVTAITSVIALIVFLSMVGAMANRRQRGYRTWGGNWLAWMLIGNMMGGGRRGGGWSGGSSWGGGGGGFGGGFGGGGGGSFGGGGAGGSW